MKMFALLLTVLLQGCSSDGNQESRVIDAVLIGKGNLYGNGDENIPRQNVVIYSPADWSLLMQKMDTRNPVSNSFSETNIDFNAFQIIAVFDEIKGNGGHTIDITQVTENEATIIVTLQNLNTGGGTSVMTQPFHIVKIPKSKKPVVFR